MTDKLLILVTCISNLLVLEHYGSRLSVHSTVYYPLLHVDASTFPFYIHLHPL